MAKICWVVPKIKRDKFTGGIYSILRHADGLSRKGHSVSVIPLLDSQPPAWLKNYEFQLIIENKWAIAHRIFWEKWSENKIEKKLHAFTGAISSLEPRAFSFPIRHGLMCERARHLLQDADITIATSFETALPVYLYGKGKLAYYAQHYEPLFSKEFDDPAYSSLIARESYRLPVNIITNSSWLEKKISSKESVKVFAIAGNAINEDMLTDSDGGKRERGAEKLRVISYGGRDAVWKGFLDMAEGMRLAREKGLDIEWVVFGDCIIPPDNSITPYKALGFLNSGQLAAAYRESHVLLSASWYESFPLFPLEAMAAGLAVITTQPGTEAFARHMETAWIVPPKDPEALCNALMEIHGDELLRRRLGAEAVREARLHTWSSAVDRMEKILLQLLN